MDTLMKSSITHIHDVTLGLQFFQSMIEYAAVRHDFDKLSGIVSFHHDFRTGFKETSWVALS